MFCGRVTEDECGKVCICFILCVRTWMVNRVLSNSRGYVHMVELTPAQAPAINDGGIGSLGCSPSFGERFLLTVS